MHDDLDLAAINRVLAARNKASMGRLYEAFRRLATCEACGQSLTADEMEDWAQNDPAAERWTCNDCASIPENIPSRQDH